MARWHYNRPSEHCDEHEIKVAKLLARLGKRWTIRWGFYYTDNKGVRREGDFLIFDPLHGLLVLEVKGHRFRQFAPTGAWEGDPATNRDHPLFQLDQEHSGVIRALDEAEPGWHPVGKALCLPNEFIPEGQATFQGIARDLIVDRRDLDRFESIFGRFFNGQQPRDLNRHREVFLKVYGKGAAPEELKHFLDHNEILFRKQLTRHYEVLDLLDANRQLLIEGGAGTGKTWHAVAQAARLAEEGDGARVLLLCYNIALGRFLRDLVSRRPLERGEIVVFHWEELAGHLLAECGLDTAAPGPEATREEKIRYYDQELPGLLLACVREAEFADRLPRFDALVVDEAQDHDTAFAGGAGLGDPAGGGDCGWWTIYFALLKEGTEAPMAIFYDRAQRPPFRGSGGFDVRRLASPLSQPAFARLPHALRYTRPVFEFLQTLRAPGTEDLVARLLEPEDLPEGPEVVKVTLTDSDETKVREAVEGILTTWLEAGYCRAEEVMILHTRTDLKKSALGDCSALAGLPLVEYGHPVELVESGKPVLRHLSINRAKGLDARGVILVGTAPFAKLTRVDDQYTYFMGASRAKQLLGVVHG
jgi:hypothetical protein